MIILVRMRLVKLVDSLSTNILNAYRYFFKEKGRVNSQILIRDIYKQNIKES